MLRYTASDGLTFAELRDANVTRMPDFGHGAFDDEKRWDPAQWGCAVAGETGELCNLLKKLIRQAPHDPSPDELFPEIAKEIADVVIYLDLLSAELGIDMGGAVRDKFNEVSDKYGYSPKLE